MDVGCYATNDINDAHLSYLLTFTFYSRVDLDQLSQKRKKRSASSYLIALSQFFPSIPLDLKLLQNRVNLASLHLCALVADLLKFILHL